MHRNIMMTRNTKLVSIRPGRGNILKDANKLRKAIGEKYHLTFDPVHRYCTTGPYHDNNGNYLSPELELDGKRYVLEYLDGCFCSFLAEVIE